MTWESAGLGQEYDSRTNYFTSPSIHSRLQSEGACRCCMRVPWVSRKATYIEYLMCNNIIVDSAVPFFICWSSSFILTRVTVFLYIILLKIILPKTPLAHLEFCFLVIGCNYPVISYPNKWLPTSSWIAIVIGTIINPLLRTCAFLETRHN